MGALCSKSNTHSGGHTLVGPSTTGQAAPGDARAAAAEAAERRLKSAQARGTHHSNPNEGRLAAKAAQPVKIVPEERREERLVWD